MDEQKAREDLEFIKNIITNAEKKVGDSGVGFIIWGIIVTVGLLSTYLAVQFRWYQIQGWNWIVLIGGGWIYTMFEVFKQKEKRRSHNFASKILGFSWFACGVTMTIIGFVGPIVRAYDGVFVSPLLSSILGMIYIITGIILGKKWISYLSIGWWTGALIMFIWPYLYTLLLMAGMMVVLQTVPGIILYLEVKKNNIEEA